jgi:hypothetical protein
MGFVPAPVDFSFFQCWFDWRLLRFHVFRFRSEHFVASASARLARWFSFAVPSASSSLFYLPCLDLNLNNEASCYSRRVFFPFMGGRRTSICVCSFPFEWQLLRLSHFPCVLCFAFLSVACCCWSLRMRWGVPSICYSLPWGRAYMLCLDVALARWCNKKKRWYVQHLEHDDLYLRCPWSYDVTVAYLFDTVYGIQHHSGYTWMFSVFFPPYSSFLPFFLSFFLSFFLLHSSRCKSGLLVEPCHPFFGAVGSCFGRPGWNDVIDKQYNGLLAELRCMLFVPIGSSALAVHEAFDALLGWSARLRSCSFMVPLNFALSSMSLSLIVLCQHRRLENQCNAEIMTHLESYVWGQSFF